MPGADIRIGTEARRGKSVGAEKAALRRLALARRDALDPRVRAQKSSRICDALTRELLGIRSSDGARRGGPGGSGDCRTGGGIDGTGTAGGADNVSGVAIVGSDRSADNAAGDHPTVALYAALGSEADPSAFAHAAERAGWRVAYPCMLPHEVAAACGQRMYMRAVAWDDHAVAPFLAHPTRAFDPHDLDDVRYPLVPAAELDAIVVPLVAFDARGMRLGYGGGCYDRYLPILSASCEVLGIAFTEQQVEHVPADAHDLPLPRIITA